MGITHNPQIYSDTCQFEFDKSRHPNGENLWIIIPHWIEFKDFPSEVQDGWVTFWLPFREDFSDTQDLAEELDTLPPQLLLFLDGLKSIEVYNDRSKRYSCISKRTTNDSLVHIQQQLLSEQKDEEPEEIGCFLTIRHSPSLHLSNEAKDAYLKQRKLDKGPEEKGIDVSKTEIILAFGIDDSGNFAAPDKNDSNIYAFFPVSSQHSGFRFLVQADFLTTTSRENLRDGNPWNTWLIQNLPDTIEASLKVLKQSEKWRLLIYEVLPLTGEIKEPFSIIEKELRGRLRQSSIILTDKVDESGKPIWIHPHESVWLPDNLKNLLTDSDLQKAWLMHDKQAFVSKDISSSRARKFLTSAKGLGIKKIDKKDMLEFLEDEEWLKTKSIDWFINLFVYICNLELKENELQNLRKLRIIPTKEGLITSEESVFLPLGEKITGAKFVDTSLADASEEIRSFLTKSLKISKGDRETLIEKVVIPELKQGYQNFEDAILEEYAAFVKSYFDHAKGTLNSEMGKKLRLCLPLRAADNSWLLAKELCLKVNEKEEYTEAGYLLDGADNRFFVASPHLQPIDTSDWIQFYEWIGVHSEPNVSILLDSLESTKWCMSKTPEWFRSLYAYLNSEASSSQIENFKYLSIVFIHSGDDLQELRRPSEKVFFTLKDADLHKFLNIFEDEDIQFVHPKILQPETDESLQAKHFLENLGIKEINQYTLLESIVIKEFKRSKEIADYPNKLLKYTRFAVDTFETKPSEELWNQFKSHVRLKTTAGCWEKPSDMYLTTKYGANDFERLLEGFSDVYFINPEYLKLEPKLGKDKWREFFTELGVNERLSVSVKNYYQNAWDDLINGNDGHDWSDYFDCYMETSVGKVLRYYGRHRIRDNAYVEYLDEILKTEDMKRSEVLIKVLGDHWEGYDGYSRLMTVKYWYDWQGSWCPYSGEEIPSYIAHQLKITNWIPTNNGLQNADTTIYRDTEEIRQLVGDEASYLTIKVLERYKPFLADCLEIIWKPEEVHPDALCNNLHHLKNTNNATAEQCVKIYQFLAGRIEDNTGYLESIKTRLNEEALIFLPKEQCQWWTPDKLFWNDYSDTFRHRRGYIRKEPAYHSLFDAFDKLGVNTGEPTAKDYAELLLELGNDNDADETNIWKSYRELEEFLRKNDEIPEWWQDFADNIKLLTEQDVFLPAKKIYIPDNVKLYKLFRDKLPFIKLSESESFRSFETLFDKLELHRITEDIEIIPEVGEVIKTEEADSIRKEIINNCDFIKSILVHRYPEQEKNFQGILDNLVERSDFEVHVVDSLNVAYQLKGQTENKKSEPEEYFYFPKEHILYLLTGKDDTMGRAAASMFEILGDLHTADFILLFSRQSSVEKRQLLEKDLGIPVLEHDTTTPRQHSLNIKSKPEGAEIFINEQLYDDKTPITVPLFCGRKYSIVARLDNREASKSLLLTSDGPDEIELTLKETSQSDTETTEQISHLIVRSEPEGAEIFINGQQHDVAPCKIDLQSGDYEVEAHLNEQKKTKSVFLKPNEEKKITLTLRKSKTQPGPSPNRLKHDKLRDYLASNPERLESGLYSSETEHRFVSGDKADIVLETVDGIPVAVEVEVEIPPGKFVGLWQAIKYKHLLAVEKGYLCGEVRAFLVGHKIADDIKQECPKYGVEWKEIPTDFS